MSKEVKTNTLKEIIEPLSSKTGGFAKTKTKAKSTQATAPNPRKNDPKNILEL